MSNITTYPEGTNLNYQYLESSHIEHIRRNWEAARLSELRGLDIEVRGVYAFQVGTRQGRLRISESPALQRRRISSYSREELTALYADVAEHDTAIAEEDIIDYARGLKEADNE